MKKLLLLTMLLLGCLNLVAEPVETVKWTTEIDSVSPTQGVIRWTADITPGWHLYGMKMPQADGMQLHPTAFVIDQCPGLTLDGEVTPSTPAQNHYDAVMQLNLPWWEKDVTFTQRFTIDDPSKGVTISGYVDYMMCSAKSCNAPKKERFSLSFGAAPVVAPVADSVKGATLPVAETNAVSADYDAQLWWEPVEITTGDADTAAAAPWMIFIIGFLGGLLALLTPCVWPMIPMTVSFFLKKGKSRARAIVDAVTYAISIIVIYLAMGLALTAIFGPGILNYIATSAVFNLLFFAMLVVFAISFFGAFDIKLPSRWSNAIDSKAETTTGFVSIFFMAFTLVLVSFSCTGPIIGTLLVEAASQGSRLGPALGMGGFALGLALPFGLFAFFPSLLKEMPRSGGWLNSVKVVLGFIELILSLKFLSVVDLAYGWRILDRETFLALWIVLFVLLGMYLLGKLRFSHDSKHEHTSVTRFFLALASLSFAVYLVPGLWGAPLKSISAFAPPLYTQDFNLYGGTFKEFDNYDEGMEYAARTHRPVLLDFTGNACVNCRKMEGAVFDTEAVRQIIEKDYVLIKLVVDDKKDLPQPITVTENGKEMLLTEVGEKWSYLQRHKFGTASQPFYVLLDNNGKPLAEARAYDDNLSVPAFVNWLETGIDNYTRKNTLDNTQPTIIASNQ